MIILVAPKRPGRKRLLGCRNSRMVSRVWLESEGDGVWLFEYAPTDATRLSEAGRPADARRSADATAPVDSRRPAGTAGPADAADVTLAGQPADAAPVEPGPGEMDAGFLAGLLSERMSGFRNEGAASVIAILSEASPEEAPRDTPLITIDEVSRVGSRTLYPDIVLGHDFHTGRGSYIPDSFSGRMLTALHPYTQTHQLLHFTLSGFDSPGGPAYRKSNALMDFLRDTALLHPAADRVSISDPGDSPI